ncbi:MAG TPA: hypothetical protein DCO79_11970 [Spirochaeta sp.]|nr:hypothetical protein [Spirochaeta sp.]
MIRNFSKNVVLLIVVTAIVMFAFAGCAKEKAAAEEPTVQAAETTDVGTAKVTKELKIGYVSMMIAADSNSRAYDSFEKEAEAKGWEIFLTDAAGDIVKVSESVMNYVSQKVDVIVITCAEITPIQEGLDAAKKAGIPVFCIDTGIDDGGAVVVNVTSNCWAMGAEAAAQIVNKLHGKGNVCIIDMPTLYVHRYRADTARAVFESADNPGIKILDTEAVTVANWETGSYDIMSAWLTKYGDDIDAVFGTWDGIGWSVAKAAADSGYTKDNMFVMTIDGTSQTYDMIRNGEPFGGVVAQNFGGWASKTAELIDEIVVQGKSAENVVPESKVIYVPHTWIDETNLPAKGADPQSIF